MRCLVKNLAMFGLGLYIYAGEDLPEVEAQAAKSELEQKIAQACAEVRASKSREDLDNAWRKWSAQVPRDDNSEFMIAVKEVAAVYPKQQ